MSLIINVLLSAFVLYNCFQNLVSTKPKGSIIRSNAKGWKNSACKLHVKLTDEYEIKLNVHVSLKKNGLIPAKIWIHTTVLYVDKGQLL